LVAVEGIVVEDFVEGTAVLVAVAEGTVWVAVEEIVVVVVEV